MQTTSQAYKTEQKQALREKSYVWVYLGVVDRTAQKEAVIDKVATPVTDWSKVPTGNEEVKEVYATYEQNFFRADGSMRFPGEQFAMYQGAASEGIGGSIKFKFGANCNISGVSLKFYDDALPTKFTITNGTVTNTYTYSELELDDAGRCKCIGDYSNSTYITISPYNSSSLRGGNQRLRIQQILFGIGFFFSNEDLLSTSYTNSVSHLSDKLPSKTFSFTIDNTNKRFSADDPHSFVHFLQEQQEIDFDYGRELPGGSIETIKGGKVYLKTWATDDQKATFNAVGLLEFVDTTFYKGHLNYVGLVRFYTLYELALEVLQDAGLTNYRLDRTQLESFSTTNPLPVEKHKNLLQLIANAAQCILFEDRDGAITIAPSVRGTVENTSNFTLQYRDLLASPSTVTTEFIKNVVCNAYFVEYINETVEVGNHDAVLGENFVIFQEPTYVDFIGYEGTTYTVSEDIRLGGALEEGGHLTFSITHGEYAYGGRGCPEGIGYRSELHLPDTYTLKVINSRGDVLATETDANEIDYYNPYSYDIGDIGVRVEYSGLEPLVVTEKDAYYVKFTATRTGKVTFIGSKSQILETPHSDNIRPIGVDKTCKNILIDHPGWAESNLAWMKDHYDDDVEYTLDYRGEPALDCDDIFYLENEFVSKNVVRATELTINTSQGMSKCTIKARRASWKDYAKVDYAKVDDSEVK